MSTLFVNNLNTASGTTITIPAGKTLKSTDTPVVGVGNIIQVLSQEITAYTGTTSTSMVATGFTLTITPKYSSSKIRCTLGMNGYYSSAVSGIAQIDLYKNGSSLANLENSAAYSHPSGQVHQSSSPIIMHMDTAGSTSATTYAIYWAKYSGGGTLYMNNYGTANNRTRSWFTVEEIAQ